MEPILRNIELSQASHEFLMRNASETPVVIGLTQLTQLTHDLKTLYKPSISIIYILTSFILISYMFSLSVMRKLRKLRNSTAGKGYRAKKMRN